MKTIIIKKYIMNINFGEHIIKYETENEVAYEWFLGNHEDAKIYYIKNRSKFNKHNEYTQEYGMKVELLKLTEISKEELNYLIELFDNKLNNHLSELYVIRFTDKNNNTFLESLHTLQYYTP